MALILVIASCKKNGVDKDVTLTGKWKLVSSYTSNGGPGEWHNLTANENIYLEYMPDGTLKGDDLASYYATYVIKDSVTLILTNKNSSVIQNYSYKTQHKFLTLSPAGPVILY